MAKFHINQKDGTVGQCRAEKGGCPFGSEDDHYTSMVAAAKAFEDSMGDQVLSSRSKTDVGYSGSKDLFTLKKPNGYKVKLSESEKLEVKNLNYPGITIYNEIREQVGPALTHWDASNIMYTFNQNLNAPGGDKRWNDAVRASGEDMDTYTLVRDFILTGQQPIYHELPEKDKLNTDLVEKAKKAMRAERKYGFPEDEMSRANQDQRESEYIDAISKLSGNSYADTKMKLQSNMAISRPHAKKYRQDLNVEIADLESKIKGLKRASLIQEKTRQLNELKREYSIRMIEDAPRNNKWRLASRAPISQAEALNLTGVPSDYDYSLMDEETQLFWAKPPTPYALRNKS